ncbi:MAG: hypothetical protein ACT4PZ_17105 [Panacagrimonas sp.]
MDNTTTFLAIAASLIGVVLGAILQGFVTRRNQKSTQLTEWRNQAYSDFLNAAGLVATVKQQGRSNELMVEQMARLSDAKARICVYGDPSVIRLLADFWRKGAVDLKSRAEIRAFTEACLEMRRSIGVSTEQVDASDISQLLFKVDLVKKDRAE